jgi:hypothetical protein
MRVDGTDARSVPPPVRAISARHVHHILFQLLVGPASPIMLQPAVDPEPTLNAAVLIGGLPGHPALPQLPAARARTFGLTAGLHLHSGREAPHNAIDWLVIFALVRSSDLTLDRGPVEALRCVGMAALAHSAHHRWVPARRGKCHH